MTASRKPGRPKGSLSPDVSAAIVAAATELFLDEGFVRVSMEKVAAKAGFPKTTLYKRYPDKRALLHAVLEARREQWSQEAGQGDWKLTENLHDRLTYYARLVLLWAGSPEVRAFQALAAAAWSLPEEAPRRLELLGLTGMLDLLERDILEFGPKAGPRPKNARRVALLLLATLTGWLEIRGASPPSEDESREMAEVAVDLLIQGSAAW